MKQYVTMKFGDIDFLVVVMFSSFCLECLWEMVATQLNDRIGEEIMSIYIRSNCLLCEKEEQT